jgi:hypothetical protein
MTKQPVLPVVLHVQYTATDRISSSLDQRKPQSNSAGRPKTITPPMLTAACDKLTISPCVCLQDMVTLLRDEFEVEVASPLQPV